MILENPPIQEVTTDQNGYFPQVWVRWFQLAGIILNQKADLIQNIRTVTATTTITTDDKNILCNVAGGSITVNLPPAADVTGYTFTIKKISTGMNTVTVNPNGSELIDNALTEVLSGATKPAITIISDGTKWWILQRQP